MFRVRQSSFGADNGSFIHGHTTGGHFTPEYISYVGMKQRCYYKKAHNYERYGGRGITVCDRWLHSFVAFLEDVGPRPTSKHTLDRYPNKNGNYEPGNVRWATPEEQANNTRQNRMVEFAGEVKTVAEWARHLGMDYGMLQSRLDREWPLDIAFDPKATIQGIAKAERSDRLQRERAEELAKLLKCPACGKPFQRKNKQFKHCSDKCRRAFAARRYYQRNAERINEKRRIK